MVLVELSESNKPGSEFRLIIQFGNEYGDVNSASEFSGVIVKCKKKRTKRKIINIRKRLTRILEVEEDVSGSEYSDIFVDAAENNKIYNS